MSKSNTQKSLVSVILPTYKRGEGLKKAIESVLSQNYKNLELIVIDDTPDDSISDIVSEIKDSRIIYIKNKERLGFVKSLNEGVALGKGKYIARIDSDDFWCDSKKLEKQVNFLEKHPDYVLCGGGIVIVNEKGKEITRFLYPEKNNKIREIMLFWSQGQFAHSAITFRRDTYQSVGGYDERLNFCEDWDLWLRMGRIGKLYNFQDYFIYYFRGVDNRSNWKQNFKISLKLKRKYRNNYPHFYKSVLFDWIYYFYNFLSLQRVFHPISPKLKKIILNIVAKKS